MALSKNPSASSGQTHRPLQNRCNWLGSSGTTTFDWLRPGRAACWARRSFQGGARQQADQQSRQLQGGHAVPRQHLGQADGHGAPATAALSAVGAIGALPSRALPLGVVGIVAQDTAVAIQRAAQAPVGAALLLARKSSVCNARLSRTKRSRDGVGGITG